MVLELTVHPLAETPQERLLRRKQMLEYGAETAKVALGHLSRAHRPGPQSARTTIGRD